ncbi:MAG: hypothetical protein MR877_08445 [Spirochaetia bacterium]|nr:hypothetical protein [Spirochaetia bacterium]
MISQLIILYFSLFFDLMICCIDSGNIYLKTISSKPAVNAKVSKQNNFC